MNELEMKTKLRVLSEEHRPSILQEVAREYFEHSYESVADFFNDLLHHGCSSGMVTRLIYYCDTHEFFQTHYEEIETLRSDYEEMTGQPLIPQGDLMDWYSWFAFEEVAKTLAITLGIISE